MKKKILEEIQEALKRADKLNDKVSKEYVKLFLETLLSKISKIKAETKIKEYRKRAKLLLDKEYGCRTTKLKSGTFRFSSPNYFTVEITITALMIQLLEKE